MKKLMLALFVLAPIANACEFNTDCAIGSTCVKQGYNLQGICMAGMNPGNKNDQKPFEPEPYTAPKYKTQSVGNTCSFNIDCSIGEKCAKGAGQITGVCVK
jgi:hypothetical protein